MAAAARLNPKVVGSFLEARALDATYENEQQRRNELTLSEIARRHEDDGGTEADQEQGAEPLCDAARQAENAAGDECRRTHEQR